MSTSESSGQDENAPYSPSKRKHSSDEEHSSESADSAETDEMDEEVNND